MHELKNARGALSRIVCRSDAEAIAKAREIVKRFGSPVTVFKIRGRDGRKRFVAKVKPA